MVKIESLPAPAIEQNWEEILLRTQRIWCTSRAKFRDVRIEVGRLLSQYLVARLRLTDTMSLRERHSSQSTRQGVIRYAAKALDLWDYSVNELIRTWHVVNLLSDNGDVGLLTYSTIAAFSRLIDYQRGRVKRSTGTGDILPSEREIWQVRDPKDVHIGMFRQAVRDGWTVDRVRTSLANKAQNKVEALSQIKDRRSEGGKPTILTIRSMVENATPKDAVDIIYEMVLASPDPITVATSVFDRIKRNGR